MAALGNGSRRRPSMLGALGVLLAFVTFVQGDNFHYGHISWKQCMDTTSVEGGSFGFEDVLFPEVCTTSVGGQGRAGLGPRSFGFTIEAAWPVDNTEQSMLSDPNSEIAAWKSGDCFNYPPGGQRGCVLTLGQGLLQTNKRVIGYKKGRGQRAYVPNNGPNVNTKGELVADGGGYKFVITGMDADEKYVFARFSFQLDFVEDGDYTVYFEGCCRPGELKNNAKIVFHLRSEVRVSAANYMQYPLASFLFRMPEYVELKHQGIGACTPLNCGNSDCSTQFKVQGYHPQDRFHRSTRMRLGDAYEQGRYKCYRHQIETNPNTPFVLSSGKCPSTVDTTLQFGNPPLSFVAPDKTLVVNDNTGAGGEAGVIRFTVRTTGSYQMTIMSETPVDDGTGDKLLNVLDVTALPENFPGSSLVIVKVTQFIDSDQPLNTYDPAILAFQPWRFNPISIECGSGGKGLFTIGDSVQNSLSIRVTDPDSLARSTVCTRNIPQELQWIAPSLPLAQGMQMVNFTNIAEAKAESKLTWVPVCEKRSQLGLFMFCFTGKDDFTGSSFQPARTIPSVYMPTEEIWGGTTNQPYNPSCLFINVNPPRPNPPPHVSAQSPPGTGTVFSTACFKDVCGCCSTLPCACSNVKPCLKDMSAIGEQWEIRVIADAENDFFPLDVRIVYYLDMDDDVVGVELPRNPDTVASHYVPSGVGSGIVKLFEVGPKQIGANGVVSRNVKFLIPEDPQLTLGTRSLRLCYRANQTAVGVDAAAWREVHGEEPVQETCEYCVKVNIVREPKFLGLVGTGEFPVVHYVEVGKPEVLHLEGINSGAGSIEIYVLSDPGAPDGTVLTDGVMGSNGILVRDLIYTPKIGQEGFTYLACLVVVNSEGLRSASNCHKFIVQKTSISWARTTPCPWKSLDPGVTICSSTGYQVVAVGCKNTYAIEADTGATATSPGLYDVKLYMVEAPKCENCVFSDKDIFLETSIAVYRCNELGANATGACCGNGVCDGAETGMNCPGDCPPDDASLVISDTDSFKGTFTFTAMRHQQGRKLLTCIGGTTDVAGTQVFNEHRGGVEGPSLCILFDVQSCRYCVPAGATLKSVARHYLLNINWLRLYNNNPDVSNPDMLLTEREIVVGPLYSVQPGDTLLSIAASTRTTVRSLVENNPTIGADSLIVPGDKVCVLLCSNAPN